MNQCETHPLCEDQRIDGTGGPFLTEPVEVGPYVEGIVFVRIAAISGTASVDVNVGISPIGYEEWDVHWTTTNSLGELEEAGMYSLPLTDFGNWLRLQLSTMENLMNRSDFSRGLPGRGRPEFDPPMFQWW